MKKINFFSIAVITLAGLFYGCSNITEPKSAVNDSEKMVVTLARNKARAIYAAAYKLTEIKEWTLTFTGTFLGSEKEYVFSTASSDEESQATWNGSDTFTMTKIPVGTYTLEIVGAVSDTVEICGTNSSFTVSASDSEQTVTNAAVDVHLKSEGTGSLNLTLDTESLSDTGSLTANNISSFKAVLTPVNGINNDTPIELTSSDGVTVNDSGNVVLSKSDIPSGWYVISFVFNDGTNQYKYKISEYNVQIADGITTTSEQKLSCITQKTYYATNSTSTYAGGAKDYPANLTTLLGTTLASSLPDVTDINIYMTDDEVAEIDIAALTSLQSALKSKIDEKEYYSINIYNSSDTETAVLCLNNNNPDISGVDTVISGSVDVSATDDNTSLTVSSVMPSFSSIIVTLKDGASLNTDGLNFGNSNIAFRTVDSSAGADNFSAYVSSPFVTYTSTDASDIEKSLLLYAYNGTSALSSWTCISIESTDSDTQTTTYSVYVLPAAEATTSIVNLAESAAITAVDSDSASYTTGSKITYADTDLTFSLSGLDGFSVSSYYWFVNGELTGNSKTLAFNPTEELAILPDETNIVACYVVVNSTVYLAEMSFTFKADYNTNAVYIDSSSALMQIAYDSSSANGTAVMQDTSTSVYYAFDGEGNMYAATWGNCLSLYKYKKSITSGTFPSAATVSAEFTDISTQPAYADICYDIVNDLVYVLWTISTITDNTTTYSSTVYAFTCSDSSFTQVASTTVSVPAALTSTIAGKFSQIAVNGSNVYLADADLNVLKVDFNVSQTEDGVTVTPGTPSAICLGAIVKTKVGIDTSLYDANDWDSVEITDLLVGDGCGNETSTLYALVREASSTIYGGGTDNIFSRGALVAFDTSGSTDPVVKGWSTTSTTLSTSGKPALYAPLYTETSAFFGPVHFACVMPKKLVIADDGFATKDADENLYNKDGFFVFDIEEASLTQQEASVTMSTPEQGNSSSDFTIN